MGEICDFQITFPVQIAARVHQLAKQALKQKISTTDAYITWLETLPNNEISDIVSFLGEALNYAISDKCVIKSEWASFSESVPARGMCDIHYSKDCSWKKGCGKLLLLKSSVRKHFFEVDANLSELSPTELNDLLSAGVIHKRVAIGSSYYVDESVNFVLGHDKKFILHTISLIEAYHNSDLNDLTNMLHPKDQLSLGTFVAKIPTEGTEREKYFIKYLTKWRDDYPGERNLPLSYLYVIARSVDKKFSHEYLSAYCRLPMIGGISPIPMFLYGRKRLSDEIVNKIASCFVELLSNKAIPNEAQLHLQMLYETEDKLIKHRYVNSLLYATIGKCIDGGLCVNHPQQPEVLIGNEIAKHCSEKKTGVSTGTAQTHFSFEVQYRGHQFVFLVIAAYSATHKHKEYPARWRCSNIEYDQGYQYRSNDRHWVVVLDGIWSELFRDFDDCLDKFASAGADAIYDISSFLCIADIKTVLEKMIDG